MFVSLPEKLEQSLDRTLQESAGCEIQSHISRKKFSLNISECWKKMPASYEWKKYKLSVRP